MYLYVFRRRRNNGNNIIRLPSRSDRAKDFIGNQIFLVLKCNVFYKINLNLDCLLAVVIPIENLFQWPLFSNDIETCSYSFLYDRDNRRLCSVGQSQSNEQKKNPNHFEKERVSRAHRSQERKRQRVFTFYVEESQRSFLGGVGYF